MTSLRGDVAVPASERVSRHSASPPPVEHRWSAWLVAPLLVAVLLIAGGAWWLLNSTVPVGDYDAVKAELEDTKDHLANTQEALLAVQSRFDHVDQAALLLGYFAGVDSSIVDQRLYESWSGVVKLDTAVDTIDDPVLTELYWQHMGEGGFSPGSEELVLRLVELTIEPILQGP